MPGAPIIFRALDIGYMEDTVLYVVVEKDGKWIMEEEFRGKRVTLERVSHYIREATAPHKPVVIPDNMPQVREMLRHDGIKAV